MSVLTPRWHARALLATVITLSTSLLAAGSAAAQTAGAGALRVVAEADSTTLRNVGGSATPFSLRLPDGASCPGDSANGGYRVQSFMVPANVDPSTLRYKSSIPDAPGSYSLFDTYTNGYVQEQTANQEKQGGPGRIVNIPTFSYAVFPPGTLPNGRYHIGVACTLINATVRSWSVDILLTNTSTDKPAGFRWKVAHTQKAVATGSALSQLMFIAAIALALIAGVLFFRRPAARRARAA